jgi:transcriptional regulator with XRE-family HTH domain
MSRCNIRQGLRDCRELRGLSQSELAERTGLKPSAISHFETGQRAPSLANLVRLADALDVPLDTLCLRSRVSVFEPTA